MPIEFHRCQFCGALYSPVAGRVPSQACSSCWLEIQAQIARDPDSVAYDDKGAHVLDWEARSLMRIKARVCEDIRRAMLRGAREGMAVQ